MFQQTLRPLPTLRLTSRPPYTIVSSNRLRRVLAVARRRSDSLTQKIAEVKGLIHMVLEALRELQQLHVPEKEAEGHATF